MRRDDDRQSAQPQGAGYPSAAALAMARAQKRLAEKYQDQDLASHAAVLEERAQQALSEGRADLAPLS